jgi:hypothetical protein
MIWTDELKEKYKKWKDLINMSPSQIQSFLDSEDGKVAGLSRGEASNLGISSGRDSARAIIRMLEKKREEWTTADIKWMNKQISFISRMSGNPGPLYDKNGKKTRKHLSLLVWGHNPAKKLNEHYEVANKYL